MAQAILLPRLAEALYRQGLWRSQAEIAGALGTSPSALQPWAQALQHQRVLQQRDDGLAVDRDRLLRYFTALRMASHRPLRPFHCPFEIHEIRRRLDARHVDHVFGFFSAANTYAFFEPRRDVQIFVAKGTWSQAKGALPSRFNLGDSFTLVQPFEEPLAQIPRTIRDGLPVTTPILTVLDLRAHPEGGAHADFLERNLLPRMVKP